MTRWLLALLFAFGTVTFLSACEDKTDLEEAADEAGETIKEGAEDTGDAIKEGVEDTGDAIEDATN